MRSGHPMAGCRPGPTAAASGMHRMRRWSNALGPIDLDADFVVIHLNEPDTTSHLYGPDSGEAMEQYRSTDAAYGEVIARFTEGWDDTIVFTLSDHDQETITDGYPVDLGAAFDGVDRVDVAHDGTAALVHVAPDARSPADDHLLERDRSRTGRRGDCSAGAGRVDGVDRAGPGLRRAPDPARWPARQPAVPYADGDRVGR